MELEKLTIDISSEQIKRVEEFKDRMLRYGNPVEFVNNMYGCHAKDQSEDYFQTIFEE